MNGAASLDDRELLALVLGAGSARSRAWLPNLLHADPLELVDSEILSTRAAARLAGAVELVRRLSAARHDQPRLVSASAIWAHVRPTLPGARREQFRVLCLDARSRLLREVVVCEGSVDSCHVDPREVFAPALACRATAVVLVHNHPSGDPEPSLQDIQLTRQLHHSGELLCVRVLDHLVVTDTGFVSMMQRRLFDFQPGQAVPRLQ